MRDCIFCDIIAGESPSSMVYEDALAIAFMDIQPVNTGHVLVVPREHFTYLSEMDEETGAQLFRVAIRVQEAIRRSGIKCEGINLFLADGEAAGQEVFHVHLHVFPPARLPALRGRHLQDRRRLEHIPAPPGVGRSSGEDKADDGRWTMDDGRRRKREDAKNTKNAQRLRIVGYGLTTNN